MKNLVVIALSLFIFGGCSIFLPVVIPLTEDERIQANNLAEGEVVTLVPKEFAGTIEPFGLDISEKDAETVEVYISVLKSSRKWGGPKKVTEYKNILEDEIYKLNNKKRLNHFLRILATADLDYEVQEIMREYTIWARR